MMYLTLKKNKIQTKTLKNFVETLLQTVALRPKLGLRHT